MGKMDYRKNCFNFEGGIILTDKEAFCEQIRFCEQSMYSLAYSIVKNESDAVEIISESIYRAYKNSDTLKNKDSFKPWILRIVHNTAVEMIRKNSKVIPLEQIPQTHCENSENQITEKLDVRKAIENLKQPYRTVVILYYYEDFSISKIAQITDTNIMTVKKQLSRARQMLRDVLKEDFTNE